MKLLHPGTRRLGLHQHPSRRAIRPHGA
jgi:hypothetical protein